MPSSPLQPRPSAILGRRPTHLEGPACPESDADDFGAQATQPLIEDSDAPKDQKTVPTPTEPTKAAAHEHSSSVSPGILTPQTEGTTEEEETKRAWDFDLPLFPAPPILMPGLGEHSSKFNLQDLIGALQGGASADSIKNYLGYYDKAVVQKQLNETLQGIPSIFFAVASDNQKIIRAWVSFGANVEAVHPASLTPLLAFSILRGKEWSLGSTFFNVFLEHLNV